MKVADMILDEIRYKFFEYGFAYYLSARFSALARQSLVTGNLYHHAIENFLKSGLSSTYTPAQLKNKFGHNLHRPWDEFKARFPSENLSIWDSLIADLHLWEDIRYPDELIQNGAQLAIAWDSRGVSGTGSMPVPPLYRVTVRDLDKFVHVLIPLLNVNAKAFTGMVNQWGLNVAKHENPEAVNWFNR
jgi:hypothetical protein